MTATARRAMLVGALSFSLTHAAWPQVFRSRVEVVRLDVSVTRGSTPVTGLAARDFIVTDDGVGQEIESTQLEQVPLRVQVAFDASGSVAGRRLRALQAAVGRLLDALRPGDRVGVLTFSNRLQVRATMSDDRAAARTSLDRVVPVGQTALRDAVALGVTLAGGDAARGLLLLFTDGQDNASWISGDGALDVARRADVVVHVVSVGAARTPFLAVGDETQPVRFIDRLVDVTGGREWTASSGDDLARLATAAFDEMRARYLLIYQPKGQSRPGWHEVKVRLRNGGATVRVRPGYVVGG